SPNVVTHLFNHGDRSRSLNPGWQRHRRVNLLIERGRNGFELVAGFQEGVAHRARNIAQRRSGLPIDSAHLLHDLVALVADLPEGLPPFGGVLPDFRASLPDSRLKSWVC